MKGVALVGLGVVAGMVLATYLRTPSSCCQTLAQEVRRKAASSWGEGIASLGDALGVWNWAPGLVGFLQPRSA